MKKRCNFAADFQMKNMKKELKKKYLLSALVCVAVVTGIIYYYFFEGFSTKDKTEYV